MEGKENMNAEPACSNIQSVSGMKHKELLIVISPGELERDQEFFFHISLVLEFVYLEHMIIIIMNVSILPDLKSRWSHSTVYILRAGS